MGILAIFALLLYPLMLPVLLLRGDFEGIATYFEMFPDIFKFSNMSIGFILAEVFGKLFEPITNLF